MQMITVNSTNVSSEESQTAVSAQPTTSAWTKPSFESFPLNEAMAVAGVAAVDGGIFS